MKRTTNQIAMTDSLVTQVKTMTNNYSEILSVEQAVKLGIHGGPGNGSGDRMAITKIFINTTIYGGKRKPHTYPSEYDDGMDLSEYEGKIEDYKKSRIHNDLKMGGSTIGFIIHDINTNERELRPISDEIGACYRGKKCVCVKCGAKKTVCDHKNDLYNDKRVLCIATQTKDDFQSLCNGCNLRKRAVNLKTKKEKKRQPPPPDIMVFGIAFTVGDETYDPEDINAMVGTYWYDPIAFMKEIKRRIESAAISAALVEAGIIQAAP
jgi:hypothetical protein